ncbi:hypothetical protein CH063_15056 [Colletotrichum higginsianum]|uniref:Uncharacterized protein n=1 Tax=Colletotrichum higginsianum (strain IMI 349063) TaxID=759273 RepID=H1W180_COLHI|nr:hypothetical protein CH063_15056 [Colletotrichum higginsianum]
MSRPRRSRSRGLSECGAAEHSSLTDAQRRSSLAAVVGWGSELDGTVTAYGLTY